MTVSFDLDGVVWRNPFNKGVGPRLREHMRTLPALAGLTPDEADKRSMDAFREYSRGRMQAGDYVGASAEASVVIGGGANVLVGGSDQTITLQPISIQTQTGLNLAIGVAEFQLRTTVD